MHFLKFYCDDSYLDVLIIFGKGDSIVNIVSYKLSAAYFITKLSAEAIIDNDWKISIACGKFHVLHDVTILLS